MSTAMTPAVVADDGFTRTLKDCGAGAVGGILQVLVGQPFDTIKVRLQSQPTVQPGIPALYSGPLDCLQRTVKNEGFMGLYKGTLTPLLGIGVCASIQFVALEHMKRVFGAKHHESTFLGGRPVLSHGELFLAGAIAGTANSVVSGPVEHIRTRLQVQTGAPGAQNAPVYKGPLDLVRRIYSAHGLAGVYKGQVPTIVREFLGYGVYFASYEHMMQRAMRNEGKRREELEAWKVCGFGALSGYILWIIIYPIDAVKSKIQTDGLVPSLQKYRGMADCLRKTLQREGIAGFYRGFVPCMLRAAPANGATFMGFELAIRFLN